MVINGNTKMVIPVASGDCYHALQPAWGNAMKQLGMALFCALAISGSPVAAEQEDLLTTEEIRELQRQYRAGEIDAFEVLMAITGGGEGEGEPDEEKGSPYGPNTEEAGFGQWLVREQKSAMTDFENVIYILPGSEEYEETLPWGTRPILALRCMENDTSLLVNWGTFFFGTDEKVSVRWRKDSEDPNWDTWYVGSTNEMAGLLGESAQLRMELWYGAERLVVELNEDGEAPTRAVFETAGFNKAAGRVADRCGWDYKGDLVASPDRNEGDDGASTEGDDEL